MAMITSRSFRRGLKQNTAAEHDPVGPHGPYRSSSPTVTTESVPTPDPSPTTRTRGTCRAVRSISGGAL